MSITSGQQTLKEKKMAESNLSKNLQMLFRDNEKLAKRIIENVKKAEKEDKK